MAPRSVSRRPLSVKKHHQTYGLIVVLTVDLCNCDNRCRDCCIFNCSALVSALVFICLARSFAAFAFAFIRSTRFSAAPLCLISSSVIPAPNKQYLYGLWDRHAGRHLYGRAQHIVTTVHHLKQQLGVVRVACEQECLSNSGSAIRQHDPNVCKVWIHIATNVLMLNAPAQACSRHCVPRTVRQSWLWPKWCSVQSPAR